MDSKYILKAIEYLKGIYENGTGGGGGGASTIADGADATQGAKADAVATSNTGTFSLIALIKRLLNNSQQNLPYGADYMVQSNADSSGNYQTITYKTGGSGGTIVKTLTLTFNSSGVVLTITES